MNPKFAGGTAPPWHRELTRARVSVAIATHNRKEMAEEAVRAALSQSLAPWEIVVADDASIDGTAEHLEETRKLGRCPGMERVRILRFGENLRVGNWNRAMNEACGDFIAWCSDDDRFLPGHLEESVKYLMDHPEIGMVHSGFIDSLEPDSSEMGSLESDQLGAISAANVGAGHAAKPASREDDPNTTASTARMAVDATQEVRPLRCRRALVVNRQNLIPYMIRYYNWPFHPSTLVMRRKVWERVGPFDALYELADTDWFVRSAQQFNIALLPRHGVINRRHPGNWSNRMGSARMQREIFAIVNRAIGERWPGNNCKQKMLRAAWRIIWSAQVKLRLALTIRSRLRSGHTAAALQSWFALVADSGFRLPRVCEHVGRELIKRWAADEKTQTSSRGKLSPL